MGRAEYERQAAPADAEPAGPGVGQPHEPDAGAEDGDMVDAEVVEESLATADADDASPGEGDGEGDAEDGTEVLDPLAVAEQQRDEYLDLLRRERAEFENFRKRANRERMEALDRGAESIVNELLGVLDNFGFVLNAAAESEDAQLSKGVQMAHGELVRTLEAAGLEQVPGRGAPFDPTHHEAMMQVEADEPVDEPTVVEVLRPGYRFKGRVLRAASVSVAQ